MSPDKITEARMKYAGFSLEELNGKNFKVTGKDGLREIATEVGIRHIDRSGVEVATGKARKEELASAIYEACKVYHESKESLKVDKPMKATTLSDGEVKSKYKNSYEEMDNLARYFYEGKFNEKTNKWEFVGLRECSVRMAQNPFCSEFFELVAKVRPTLENFVRERSKSNEISQNTLSNKRAELMKRIEIFVNRENENYSIPVKKAFSNFENAVMSSFKDIQTTKSSVSITNLNKRQNNAIEVKVVNLIQWAKDTVTNLPESTTEWREVAIAIMVLTGRRQSEIMATAKFEPTSDDSHLIFSGQLKKHSFGVVQAYEIPVLANTANAILSAMTWLENNGKRCLPVDESDESQTDAAKKAHDRFSRYLSEKAKTLCDTYIQTIDEASLVQKGESGKLKDRRNCHLMRQIYGQLAIPVFYPSVKGIRRKAAQILAEIMGHSSRESSMKHAAQAYDTDIFIVEEDVSEIKNLHRF